MLRLLATPQRRRSRSVPVRFFLASLRRWLMHIHSHMFCYRKRRSTQSDRSRASKHVHPMRLRFRRVASETQRTSKHRFRHALRLRCDSAILNRTSRFQVKVAGGGCCDSLRRRTTIHSWCFGLFFTVL